MHAGRQRRQRGGQHAGHVEQRIAVDDHVARPRALQLHRRPGREDLVGVGMDGQLGRPGSAAGMEIGGHVVGADHAFVQQPVQRLGGARAVEVERFLERGAERRDQVVRQVADEAHGIRHHHIARPFDPDAAGGRIERGEQLVRRVGVGAGQGIEQRRLAGVGVPHQRHRQRAATGPRAALRDALALDRLGQGAEHHGARRLEARQVFAAIGDQLVRAARCALFQRDEGAGRFAPHCIGARHHGGFQHVGVAVQHAFDLDGRDVFAAGDDDVLGAVLDLDVATNWHRCFLLPATSIAKPLRSNPPNSCGLAPRRHSYQRVEQSRHFCRSSITLNSRCSSPASWPTTSRPSSKP